MFVFSGCGAPDCTEQDSTYTKYTYDEELKECKVLKQIPEDECGNNVAEEGETFCNCADDIMKTLPLKKEDVMDKKVSF